MDEENNSFQAFLKSRAIPEDSIKYFREEHFDENAVLLLDTSRLEELIPKCGDRLAVLDYCRNKTNPQKFSLIEKLRMKIKKKHPNEENNKGLMKKMKSSTNTKNTRCIEIGWLVDLKNDGCYTQVRAKQGGGTRKVSVGKNTMKSDLLELGISFFFPNGISSKGPLTDFDVDLLDFKQNEIDSAITVNDLFVTTGLTRLRFYLATKKKTNAVQSTSLEKYCRLKLKKKPVKYVISSDSSDEDNNSDVCLKAKEENIPTFDQAPSFHIDRNENINGNCSLSGTLSFLECELNGLNATNGGFNSNDNLNNIVASTEVVEVEFSTDVVNGTKITNFYNDATEVFQLNTNDSDNNLLGNVQKVNNKQTEFEAFTLKDILTILSNNIDQEKTNYFNIYRNDVFKCVLRGLRRKSFSEFHKISVLFTDSENVSEGAVDSGGPTREMFSLTLKFLKDSNLFEGHDRKYISRNNEAFENREYYEAGRIIALSLVHCGMGPRFFSNFFYKMITKGIDSVEPQIEDINNDEIRKEIELASNALDLTSLRTVLIESKFLGIAGWENIRDFNKKDIMLRDVLRFYSVEKNSDCFNQFLNGLQTLNVLNYLQNFSELFEETMCNPTLLTYEYFRELFSVNYSISGSNKRSIESKIVSFWQDFLLDCSENTNNGNESECTLKEILQFWTGTDIVPALGFEPKLSVDFLHEDLSRYPKSNTCAFKLYLPTVHLQYDDFKNYIIFGIKNGMVFGLA